MTCKGCQERRDALLRSYDAVARAIREMSKKRLRPWEQPWRQWYQLQIWRNKRKHQLHSEPLCAICLRNGLVTPATIADHIIEHRGNWNEFLNGKLQSLCSNCHESGKDFLNKHGRPRPVIGADGYPISPPTRD